MPSQRLPSTLGDGAPIVMTAFRGGCWLLMSSTALSFARAYSPAVSRAACRIALSRRPLLHRSVMSAISSSDGGGGGNSKRAARRRRSSSLSPPDPNAPGASQSPSAASPAPAAAQLAARAPSEWLSDLHTASALASHFAKLEQPRKALELYEQARGGTSLVTTREVLPLVMRALLKMRRIELALELHQRHLRERPQLPEPGSACVLFLQLCKSGRLDEAARMLEDLLVAYPRPVGAASVAAASEEEEEPMWHAVSTVTLLAPASAHMHAHTHMRTCIYACTGDAWGARLGPFGCGR